MRSRWTDRACEDIAAQQYGVLSRRQALGAGLSGRAVARRVATGRWERVHPAVYRLPGVPPSWESALMAALLWGGPEGIVSHRAAARLFELDGVDDAPIEISIRSGAARGLGAP